MQKAQPTLPYADTEQEGHRAFQGKPFTCCHWEEQSCPSRAEKSSPAGDLPSHDLQTEVTEWQEGLAWKLRVQPKVEDREQATPASFVKLIKKLRNKTQNLVLVRYVVFPLT
jgi:hypothetical protein